jgi:multidrug efflux system outer membrane protein
MATSARIHGVRPTVLIAANVSVLALALLMAGCAVGRRGVPVGDPLPATWRNAADFPVSAPDRDLARWWTYFGDPTLTRIIELGLADNPDMAAATARIRAARAQRTAAASTLFPSVSASTSSSLGVSAADGARRVTSDTYSAGLDASWEADLFGRNRSTIAAASAELGVANENLHAVHAALAAEIATAYTRLRADQARLVVVERNLTTRRETAQLAEWRLQAGESDALESIQAAASLEQARASVPALRQSIAQTRHLLARLTGRPPAALDELLSVAVTEVPDPPARLAVGIPADTLRKRPDVRLAGYQLLASAARTRAAEADRFPSLRLSGSLGVNALGVSTWLRPDSASAGLVANLAGPIFDAGRIRANIEASDAATEQALQNYRSVVLLALSEVEDALVAVRRSTERLVTLENATVLARESDLLARQRYEAGEIDFLQVLDSQRTLLSLEETLLASRTDRTTAYIRLYQALGGGW